MWIRFRHWNPNRTKIDDRNWPPWNLNCQWFDSEPLMVLAYNRSTKMMTGMSTQLLLWVQATGRVSHPRRNLLEATDTETNYQRELTCIFKYIMQCMHIAVFFFNIYWCEHEKQVNKVFQIKMSQISYHWIAVPSRVPLASQVGHYTNLASWETHWNCDNVWGAFINDVTSLVGKGLRKDGVKIRDKFVWRHL